MKVSFSRIIRFIVSTAAVFPLTAAAPSFAQTETDLGSRISRPKRAEIPKLGFTPDERGRVAMREFARCTFATRPAKVAETLMLAPGNEGKALGSLASDDCLSDGILSFNAIIYRGALYAEMYRQRESATAAAWKWSTMPLDFTNPPDQLMPEAVRTNYFLMEMSDCIYAKEPAAVRSVIVAPVASAAQKDAFSKVVPQLAPCVPQGATLKFNRAMIEAMFGEYMYRSSVVKILRKEGAAS